MTDATTATAPTPPTSPAGPGCLEADLDALRAYVRTLADRMGLKDWTFEVSPEPDEFEDGLIGLSVIDDIPRHGLFRIAPGYFSATPEVRRFTAVRELVFHHLYIEDEIADVMGPGEGLRRIAAAWAPALPLPLVGLMRRVSR